MGVQLFLSPALFLLSSEHYAEREEKVFFFAIIECENPLFSSQPEKKNITKQNKTKQNKTKVSSEMQDKKSQAFRKGFRGSPVWQETPWKIHSAWHWDTKMALTDFPCDPRPR